VALQHSLFCTFLLAIEGSNPTHHTKRKVKRVYYFILFNSSVIVIYMPKGITVKINGDNMSILVLLTVH